MLLTNQFLTTLCTPAMTTIAGVADVVRGAIMVLFFISAILVVLVVLAQEGKGGGLAGAFGGAGAESFGVKAGTVNKFTSWLAASFLGLALLHAGLASFTTANAAAPDTSVFDEAGEKKTEAQDGSALGDAAVDPAGEKKTPPGEKPDPVDPQDGEDGDGEDGDK